MNTVWEFLLRPCSVLTVQTDVTTASAQAACCPHAEALIRLKKFTFLFEKPCLKSPV